MGSKHSTLRDLVLHQLKDLYYAERHRGKILSKMGKAATADEVRAALGRRQEQAAGHVDALEALFALLDKKPHAVPCEAMHGIIAETKALIGDFADGPALDAGLIAAVQAMEHYAIARYGALALWCRTLGLTDMIAPIEAILGETRDALGRWTALAGAASATKVPTSASLTLKGAALIGLR